MCESGRSASNERTRITVLSISGEHDLGTAPQLRDRLNAELDEGRAIVIDLSTASFVDSSILGVILEGGRRATTAGLGFEVAQADGEAVLRYSTSPACAASLVHPTRADAAEAARQAQDGRGS